MAAEASAQCVERAAGKHGAIPTRHALGIDDEAAERVGANVGIAPERVVTHGAVEHRKPGQSGEPRRCLDRLHPAQPPGPHLAVPPGRARPLAS